MGKLVINQVTTSETRQREEENKQIDDTPDEEEVLLGV